MSELEKLKREKRKEELKGNWKDVAVLCNYIGQLLSKAGNCEEALEAHQEELQISESRNDMLGVAIANRRICECYSDMGNYKKALRYGKKYLELSVKLGSKLEEQRAWATLGRTFYYVVENGNLSVLDKAENAFTESLQLVEELRDEVSAKEHAEMKARLLLNVGLIYNKRKNMSRCAESIKQAIFLTKKHSLTEDLHRCQYSLANVYEQFGNLTFALRLADEAVSSAKILKDKTLICDSLLLKVQIMIMLKDFHGAKSSCKKAYKIKSNENNDQLRAEKYLKGLYLICDTETRLKLLSEEEKIRKARCLEKIGDILSSLACYKPAVQYYIFTLENLKEAGKKDNELTAIYFSIAQTYADDEQYDKALEYFQMELNGYSGNEEEQCKTFLKIADILELLKDYKQLKIIYKNALNLAENCEQVKLQYQCLQQMKYLQEKCKIFEAEEIEEIEKKIIELDFDDRDIDSDTGYDDNPDYFDEISLSDISDCTDNEAEDETQNVSKRSRKKLDSKRNDVGETPLHRACIEGNLKFVKHLIENGHIVNPRDNCGWIPLHEASNYGYYDIVHYLIEKGAWVNDNGGELCEGITPLHDAANCGHIDIMRLLIDKGASITSRTHNGETPLDCLRKWRKRAHRDLDSRELNEILKFEDELSEKLKLIGQEELTCFQELTVSNNELSRRNIDKRQRSPSISPTANLYNCDENMDEDYDIYARDNILENEIDFSTNACSQYQSVMSNLRKSGLSTNQMPKMHIKNDKVTTALIDEDKIVKDWLLDDMKEKKHVSKKMRTSYETGTYSKSKEKRKLNQSKLPNITTSVVNNEIEYSDIHNTETSAENCKDLSQNITENASKTASKSIFCLKVKIEDKMILIPVNDLELKISWLEIEASRRYYDLIGKKPHLLLSTSDGAVLSSSDPIGLVLTNYEEVIAIVKNWEIPLLTERFKEFCGDAGLKYQSMLRKLQMTEISGELSIENINFNIKLAKPLFSALQYQENIKVLNISGCFLNDEAITLLASSLVTLRHLIVLSLRCCGLMRTGIQNISKVCFIESAETKPLQNLEKLDIAYNAIGPDFVPITSFFKYCSLSILDISGCNVERCIFQDRNFLQEMKNNLQELYLANNKLGISGLRELFTNFYVGELRKLDLFSTIKSRERNIGELFKEFLPQMTNLLHLNLSDCSLQNEDMKEITEAITFCKSLQYLNLSANPRLNATCIKHLLHSLNDNNIPITHLNLSGSINWDCDISEIYFTFSHQLNSIIFTITERLENFLNQMNTIWKRVHGKNAKCIEGPGNIIEFTLDVTF
ncbi:tonsoku-like protein [Centruroides sculpturatus]|uniref:tonsoku-like protein n=1 Tax=Centruroides sculpturatus TaxID=218467 RepID=UPI000C6CA844|nr:tonsoku-like protein [Centruroides sculpturatus]